MPACGERTPATERARLRVLAAASLTEALGRIAERYEARERVQVDVSFGASSSLVEQVLQGVEADVLITADESTLSRARAADAIDGTPLVIARNRLTLLVERGNPEAVGGLDDLARDGLVVVLCAPEVPCGSLARRMLDAAGVDVEPASLEENVKGVVAKVTLGEADAGLVYETDARAAGNDTDAVALPLASDPRFEAVYPAAVLRSSGDRRAARAFVDHLSSDAVVEELLTSGFRRP